MPSLADRVRNLNLNPFAYLRINNSSQLIEVCPVEPDCPFQPETCNLPSHSSLSWDWHIRVVHNDFPADYYIVYETRAEYEARLLRWSTNG